MKTELPERSLRIRGRLNFIVQQILELAQDYFEQWFREGHGFLIECKYPFERGELNKSALYLHQANESFYNSILLVFSNYKPKLHDIEELGGMAGNYNSELLQVFPIATPEQKKCFELLKKAYVDARYDKNYKITREHCFILLSE